MIVKITYSAELEEVPCEVAKVLSYVKADVDKISSGLKTTSNQLLAEDEVTLSVMKLESLLKQLEVIDSKIRDCHSILTGYKNIKQQQGQQENQTAENSSVKKKQSKQE